MILKILKGNRQGQYSIRIQLSLGEIPDPWQEKSHRLSQKDIDARWTKKNGQCDFGYKKGGLSPPQKNVV